MPRNIDVRLNKEAFNSVIPGSPASINIPQDRGMVHEAVYEYKSAGVRANRAKMIADLESVEMLVGGREYARYLVEHILMLDDFYGETFEDGFLPLRFAQNSRRTIQDAEVTSFVAAAHPNPKLRLNIKGTAVTPTLEMELATEGIGEDGRILTDISPKTASQRVIKHVRQTIDITSSGNTPTQFRFHDSPDLIRGFHFKGSNITEIVIEWNEQERWTFPTIEHLNRRLKSNGFVPQADHWHVVFEALNGGSVEAALDPYWGNKRNKIDFYIYTSDTTAVELLAETYAIPDLLPEKAIAS